MFNVHNPHGIKLFTRLWVGLSHLREHKFRHNFQDSLRPILQLWLAYWNNYSLLFPLLKLLKSKKNSLWKIISLLNQNDSIIVESLLFGLIGLNDKQNASIIESTIEYVITTERLITPLLWIHLSKLHFSWNL